MAERTYSEAEAAAQLPGNPAARTLKRWRLQGKVPHCRTPGGRIFYTFEQIVELGATMKRSAIGPVRHEVAPNDPTYPDMSGEARAAAE